MVVGRIWVRVKWQSGTYWCTPEPMDERALPPQSNSTTLCHCERSPRPPILYTFGQPRVEPSAVRSHHCTPRCGVCLDRKQENLVCKPDLRDFAVSQFDHFCISSLTSFFNTGFIQIYHVCTVGKVQSGRYRRYMRHVTSTQVCLRQEFVPFGMTCTFQVLQRRLRADGGSGPQCRVWLMWISMKLFVGLRSFTTFTVDNVDRYSRYLKTLSIFFNKVQSDFAWCRDLLAFPQLNLQEERTSYFLPSGQCGRSCRYPKTKHFRDMLRCERVGSLRKSTWSEKKAHHLGMSIARKSLSQPLLKSTTLSRCCCPC